MKLHEILEESILDTIKQKLGTFKGMIVGSVGKLLSIFKKSPEKQLTTIETFEAINFGKYEARVDTGATGCAIHATDIRVEDKIVHFTHNGKSYSEPLLRVKAVKNANGIADRPRIEIDYKWNGKTYTKIETSLTDRSKLKFKLLIGRNLIKELKLPVYINDSETSE